jgi:hypothetical protein
MKKVILRVLALLLILTCVSISACGGGGEKGTTSAQTQVQQQNLTGTASTTIKPVSGGSESFGGVPIYPGAKETFKIKSDQNETLNDKPAIYENRMYTTSAKRADVVAFYKDKMPANGWIEESWMEMGSGDKGGSIGQYDKKDGQAYAVVTCSDTDKEALLKIDLKYLK